MFDQPEKAKGIHGGQPLGFGSDSTGKELYKEWGIEKREGRKEKGERRKEKGERRREKGEGRREKLTGARERGQD
jgi:hypothetical protein